MKNKIMRIAIMLCLFLAIIPAKAQSDLQINIVFERFGKAKNCKMVVLNDAVLRGYKLKVYKALTYKKIGASIAPYLNSDRKKARKIREIVDNGKITSGYYMLPPLPSGLNRYILFSNLTNNSGAIIYIEGTLGPDDIMKLCYAKH